jgi:hypothetical protein
MRKATTLKLATCRLGSSGPATTLIPSLLPEDDLRDWLREQSSVPLFNQQRDAVIVEMLRSGDNPPRNISWKEFCVKVRDQCNGWINKAKD